jgi:hypothetical protein
MEKPLLFEYFSKTARVLMAEYERSREQEASFNLGRNREFFCESFLRKVLPFKLRTSSGEVWDSKGTKTGQLDLIIIREDAPALDFGTANVYLAEGVFAVIEVKSNLERTKLIEAGNSLKRVEELKPTPGRMIYITRGDEKILTRPLRIIFSYEGATWKTLSDEINERSWQNLFDLICILDRGVFVNKGRLLSWENNNQFAFVKGGPASVGILYFYLITYGNEYLARNIDITPYFEPIKGWST